jgi:type II secretory pathway predicted ATPase ExeA/septal ring-binding cell division protein DamX
MEDLRMSVAVSAVYSSSARAKATTADRSNYWRYYGLQRDPFVPGIRENEFYLSPRWEQSFDLIHYLCQEANVVLTVTGGKGYGKTTFLRHFISHFGDTLRVCQLAASPNLDVAGLIAALTRDFALPNPTGETIEEQLDEQLSQLQYSPELCLVTIDSAHRLSDDTLQALLYLIAQQSENQMRLHVLLLGETSLKERLEKLAEQNGEKDICHYVALEPFDVAETKQYLTQRMTAAGLPAALPLSAASITRIHNQTEGVPSRINAVARQVLVDDINQQSLNSVVNFFSARKTLFLGGLVVIAILLLGAIFLEHGNHRSLSIITAAKASDVASAPSVPSVSSEPTPALVANDVPFVSAPVQAELVADTFTKPIEVGSNQEIVITQSSATVENASVQNKNSANVGQVVAQQLPDNKNVRERSAHPDLQKSAIPVAATEKHPAVLANNDDQVNVDQGRDREGAVENNVGASGARPQEQVKNVNTGDRRPPLQKTHPAAKKAVATTESAHGDYTIQLLGGSSEKALAAFISKYKLQPDKVKIVRGKNKGVDWYRLDYGQYETSAAAEKAMKQLPENLQSMHPWVKKISA